MATATIGFNTATLAAQTPWWRRRDPYVLIPLVLIHATIAGPAVWGALSRPNVFPHLHELFIGVLLAQCLLLGIWAALGCLPLLVRWTLISGVFLLGLGSLALAIRQVFDNWIEVLEQGLIGGMLVTLFAALLLPLRELLSWRLDFDPARHQPLPGRRGQIGFMSIAAFSLAIAAPLTIVRLFAESMPFIDGRALFLALVVVPASILASACPAAQSLLTWRRLPLAFAAAPCWCALVALVHSLLSLWITDLSFFNDEHTWSNDWQEIASFHAGVAACIIPTFIALRLAGLKLFALPHVDPAFADPRHLRSSAAASSPIMLPKAA